MTKNIVRPMRESDINEVHEIYSAAVLGGTTSFEIDPPTAGEMTTRWRKVVDVNLPYAVAEQNERVVGFAYVSPYRSRSAYRYTVENSLYVAPWARRQGSGILLLSYLLDHSKAAGMRQVIAIISGGNPAPSINLHTKVGFRTVGTLRNVGCKFGKWLDTIIMQRTLD
ncbi:MAG: GNAT family N-acetyltransferase [Acidiferrobacteraceae bacterium]|nr:GNAT family N-acetyltransferase [Acidiferrobacteraceae bacterium]